MFSLYLFIKYILGKTQPFEDRLIADCFGWFAPEMTEHWYRLGNAILRDWRDIQHALINMPVEWAKTDPQRAAKIGIMDQAVFWLFILTFLGGF